MGAETGISWTDHTWSPWIGCQKVSPACDGCYAEHLMDARFGRVQWGPRGERKRTSESYWKQLGTWNRAALAAGRQATVFPSLCDPFDNQVEPALRREFFQAILENEALLFLLLTKRPQNIVRMVKDVGFMPANIAFGATCEDRARVKINLPYLMVAAALRPRFLFISGEPLLGDLGDLSPWLSGDPDTQNGQFEKGVKIGADGWPISPALGWVITGGETDQGAHKARPTNPQWFRSIRQQCAEHGTPFHHKQNGEFVDVDTLPSEFVEDHDVRGLTENGIVRVGKKAAGRLLDGVEHNGMPEPHHV